MIKKQTNWVIKKIGENPINLKGIRDELNKEKSNFKDELERARLFGEEGYNSDLLDDNYIKFSIKKKF